MNPLRRILKGRNLSFTLLAPLSLVVVLLLITFVYLVGNVSRQFSHLQRNIEISMQLTDTLFDILHNQAEHREALIRFQTVGDTASARWVYELQARRTRYLDELITSNILDQDQEQIIEDYRSSFVALRPIDQQFFAAVIAGDRERSQTLLDSLLSLREINDARLSDLRMATRSDLLDSERSMNQLFVKTSLYIGGLLTLAIGGLWMTAFLYRKHLLDPLKIINKGIHRATTGDLTSTLFLSDAPKELNELAANFNTMSGSLHRVTTDLESARKEAVAAAETKSKFLANMSHDIRTPMNTIVGIVELLKQDQLSNEQAQQVAVLQKSSEMLLGLINDFLDHARLEAKELQLINHSFNLQESLARVIEIIRPQGEKKGLRVETEIKGKLPATIVGDSRRLEQILMNLLSNATKFTDRGYIKLTAEAVEDGTQKTLILTVEDTGIGVSKEFLPRVFQRFAQVPSNASSHLGGTGLGLSIVKQLVELMNGTIYVNSEVGKGTSFKISLPYTEADEASIRKDKPAVRPDGPIVPAKNIRTLLLVDDVQENRFLVKAFLRHSGLDILEAENGLEAVEMFLSHKPDIILMDMRMPVLDGFAATRKIREQEAAQNLKRTRIIALTASALPEEIRMTKDAGCDFHLTKPLRIPDLRNALEG